MCFGMRVLRDVFIDDSKKEERSIVNILFYETFGSTEEGNGQKERNTRIANKKCFNQNNVLCYVS